jgi:hypothetical protein
MRITLPSPEEMSCDAALSLFHQEGEYPSQATLRQSWYDTEPGAAYPNQCGT